MSGRCQPAIAVRRLSCLALLGAALAACAPPPTRLEKVRVAAGAYLSEAVEFVAKEQGIFAAHGLDVEIVLLNNTSAALPALAGGEVDVGSCTPLNARCFNVIQRGADIRLVAARTFYDPAGCAHDAFLVRSSLLDSGRVTGPASLRGLRITSERTGSNQYYFSRLLAQGGLTMGDVEEIALPASVRGDAFARGLIDVASATEPWTTRMTRTGEARVWKRVAEVLPGHQSGYLMFGARLLHGRRDLGESFLAAYLEAARRLREEGKSVRNVEALARWTKFDADELREMCWPPTPTDPRPDPDTLAEFQEWALRSHLVDEISPADRLVDGGFVEALTAARKGGA